MTLPGRIRTTAHGPVRVSLVPAFRSCHPRGFTMMEMIVVMTMATLLMGLTLTAVTGARERAHLKEGINLVVDALQSARYKALANLEVAVSPTQECEVGDFEVEADPVATIPQQIRIVANFTDAACGSPPTGSAILETFTLPAQVQVQPFPPVISATGWPTQLAFETPSGDLLLTGISSTASSFDLVVSLRDGSLSQAVTVSTLTGIPEL